MAGKIRKVLMLGLVLWIAVLFRVPTLASQVPLFQMDIDNLNLQKGVSTNIVVILVNAQGAKITSIDGLENFSLLSQSQGSSTNISGGSTTYQEYQYYTIMPKTEGQFSLKANIQYNGRTYESNTLEVTVSESSAGGNGAAEDLFVKTVLSQTEGYLGEKIIITYELYSRYNVDDYGFTDYTAIDGIIAKDMPEDQLMAEYVYVDGVRYAKYEVKQLILDPIKSGSHTIPSFNLQVNVLTDEAPRGFFSGGISSMFGRSKPMYLQTEAKELTIKPLPSEGKPVNFSGVVGELNIDGRYSREELNYGDSLSLQVTASGNCNLDGFKNIVSGGLPGFSVYETQKDAVESVENNQYHVQKAFELILVPEKNGSVDVTPIAISYFNPVTEKYEKAEIPGVTINVLGDMPQVSGGGYTNYANVETVRIEQVNYADVSDGYLTFEINKQALYMILVGLGLILLLSVVLIWLLANKKKQDSTLKSIYKQLMASNDINEIYNLFNAMIKHCYKLSLKASSQNAVRSCLPDTGLAIQVEEIMNYMESNEEKKNTYLKDKIKGIYRTILLLNKSKARKSLA